MPAPLKTRARQSQGAGDTAADRTRNGDNETRERIVQAARILFRERGYEGTTVSQLARASGVTTPALYWHFDSKAAVCAEFLRRDFEGFVAGLRAGIAGDTPEARLRAYVSTFMDLHLSEYEFDANFGYFQLRAMLNEDAGAEVARLEREILGMLKDILVEGSQSGDFSIKDLSVTARTITTMSEYSFTWFRPTGRLTIQQVGALYAEYAVRLVKAD
jgi:AcrR family transcriptional regulator